MGFKISLDHRAWAFLLGFFFIVLFYVGLPFDFTSDYFDNIKYASQFSFPRLLYLTFNPLTPGWFFMDEIVFLRPLTTLFVKFNEFVFGPGAWSFALVEAFSCGSILWILSHLIERSGGGRFYGWLGISLFLTFPSFFFSTMSFPHLEYLNTILRLAPVVLFGYLTLGRFRSKGEFLRACLLCYFFVLLTIKLRSSDKIIPPFFITFLFLNFRSVWSRLGKKRLGVLLTFSFLLMILVVPVHLGFDKTLWTQPPRGADQKEAKIRTYHLKNIYHSLIHNPKGDFPFSTLSKDKPPLSLTESYGFFLGWAFWLFLILSIFLVHRAGRPQDPQRAPPQTQFLRHFYNLFLLLTFFFALTFGSDLSSSDLRYLSFILMPSVPLFIFSILLFEHYAFLSNQSRQDLKVSRKLAAFRLVLLAGFFFTVETNLGFFFKDLEHFAGGMTYAFVHSVEKVYQDFYGTEPRGHDLYLKFGELYNKNLGIDWHDSWPEKSKEMYGGALKGKALYVLSQSAQAPDLSPFTDGKRFLSATTLGQTNFLDAPPLGFKILKAVRAHRKKQHHIYIYKISLLPTGVP